jgi:hypothetical protein
MSIEVKVERKKPARVFVPLGRVMRGEVVEGGTDYRVVEGHAFVNEWVGDGVNLLRSAMIAASEDYMKWGAVREMHQPSAVGTAIGEVVVRSEGGDSETLPLGVMWDERGAFFRCKVVDPTAILKLDEGVYRGFSVGVAARVVRGNNWEKVAWIENSLVDRPADTDADFTAIRVDGAAEDVECVRYYDGPRTFAQVQEEVKEQDLYDDLRGAFYAFLNCCWSIIEDGGGDPALLNQNLDEFTAYVKSEIFPEAAASDMEERAAKIRKALDSMKSAGDALEALPATTTRAATAETELSRLKGELTGAQKELETARASMKDLQAEVKRLEALPDPKQPRPVKFAGAERTFTLNNAETDLETRQAEVKTEVERLMEEAQKPETTNARRSEISTEIMLLQQGTARK